MPRGIMRKIFITTTTLMVCFFIFQIIFQNTFLASLYKKASINSVDKSFNAFIETFSSKYHPDIKKIFDASEYSFNTNTPLLILNDDLEVINDDFFQNLNTLMINIGPMQRIYIIIDKKQYSDLSFYNLVHGSKVNVTGISFGNSIYIDPLYFTIKENKYVNAASVKQLSKSNDIKELYKTYSGYLNTINYFSENNDTIYTKSKYLYDTVYEILKTYPNITYYIKKNSIKYYTNTTNAKEYAVIAKTKIINGKNIHFFTLQNIDNLSIAFNLLNSYNFYIYAIFLIIISIACFYYSKWISTPLIALNKYAKKIADLDFSDRLGINTNDELEELSKSLNQVSDNFKQTINDLKISNKKLSEEVRIKYEAEKRIRYLLTNLSHEFKTPLSIVSAAKNIIEDKLFEKEPKYYFDTITEEIDKLNNMINEVIELSKLESGYFKLYMTKFNMKDLIEKTINYTTLQLTTKNLLLVTQIEEYSVIGDPKKIEQVLLNLISNAINYTPSGGNIKIISEMVPKNSIYVSITNDGYLSSDELGKIWNQYYKATNQTEFFSKGTGLGLEITKRILELHNSKYDAIVKNNKITFYFTLEIANNNNAQT